MWFRGPFLQLLLRRSAAPAGVAGRQRAGRVIRGKSQQAPTSLCVLTPPPLVCAAGTLGLPCKRTTPAPAAATARQRRAPLSVHVRAFDSVQRTWRHDRWCTASRWCRSSMAWTVNPATSSWAASSFCPLLYPSWSMPMAVRHLKSPACIMLQGVLTKPFAVVLAHCSRLALLPYSAQCT